MSLSLSCTVSPQTDDKISCAPLSGITQKEDKNRQIQRTIKLCHLFDTSTETNEFPTSPKDRKKATCVFNTQSAVLDNFSVSATTFQENYKAKWPLLEMDMTQFLSGLCTAMRKEGC